MNEALLSAGEVSAVDNRNVQATFSIFTVGFYLQQTSLDASHFSKTKAESLNLRLHSHVVNIKPLEIVSLLRSIGRI